MNFQPGLADLVMAGRKTVTRRVANDNPNSPWYRGGCALKVGRDYAVCPGRAKHQVGRVKVIAVDLQALGGLSEEEARREGFASVTEFEETFTKLNGGYHPELWVWRVEFEVLRG